MAAVALFLFLGCARRRPLFGFSRNPNRNLNRAFSATTDSTQQQQPPPVMDPDPCSQPGWRESRLKDAESWEHWESFNSWASEYDKSYWSDYEAWYRYTIYCESKKQVETLNKEEGAEFKYALNFFADIPTTHFSPGYPTGMIRFRMPRSTLV